MTDTSFTHYERGAESKERICVCSTVMSAYLENISYANWSVSMPRIADADYLVVSLSTTISKESDRKPTTYSSLECLPLSPPSLPSFCSTKQGLCGRAYLPPRFKLYPSNKFQQTINFHREVDLDTVPA